MNLKDDKAPILSIFNSLIKNHDLNSQYFLDWIFINFQATDLSWNVSGSFLEPDKKTKNTFSVSGYGKNTQIGLFEEENGIVSYKINDDISFENILLNNLIKNTLIGESQEDSLFTCDDSVYGPFRLRIARMSNLLMARILFTEWPKPEFNVHYYIKPLKIILTHYKNNKDIFTDEQLNEIKKTYQNIMGENIDLNNVDESIRLLTELGEILGIIDY